MINIIWVFPKSQKDLVEASQYKQSAKLLVYDEIIEILNENLWQRLWLTLLRYDDGLRLNFCL